MYLWLCVCAKQLYWCGKSLPGRVEVEGCSLGPGIAAPPSLSSRSGADVQTVHFPPLMFPREATDSTLHFLRSPARHPTSLKEIGWTHVQETQRITAPTRVAVHQQEANRSMFSRPNLHFNCLAGVLVLERWDCVESRWAVRALENCFFWSLPTSYWRRAGNRA